MVDITVLTLTQDPMEYIAAQSLDDPASHLTVFPTARNIRHFHKALSLKNGQRAVVSPYCQGMNAFITRCLDSGEKALVTGHLRPFYLQQAIGKVERSRLDELFKGGSADLQQDFIEFAATGGRILRFYDEIYAEKITTEMLKKASLYTDYERHIGVLEDIARAYQAVLSEDGFTDPMFLKTGGNMRMDWLEGFQQIHFLVGGYLTRFELDLLKTIGEEKEMEIILRYEGKPDEQIKKIFEAFEVEPPSMNRVNLPSAVEIRAYEEAAGQFGFIIHSIERALRSGISPGEIAVVLPDENMKRILFSLDRRRIFNYSMGLDFRDSVWYSFLKSIEKLFIERTDSTEYRSESVVSFLKHPFIANLHEKEKWINDLISNLKEKNRLILRESDFCKTENLKDFFSRIKSLLTGERGYGTFLLDVAAFLDDLDAKVDEGFMESISKSPEFNEARKAMMNYLYQSASLPYDRVCRGRNPLRHLSYLTGQLARFTYNDVAGGFITVMGMLETRNLTFRAVIIPDMNEEMIPPGNEKEMFLNTAIRERLGIPAYHDRENLARHYFLDLVKNSEMVFLSYVERDDRPIRSRFIEEILIETGHTGDNPIWLEQTREYEDLLFHAQPIKAESVLPDVIPGDTMVLKCIEGMTFNSYKLTTYRLCSYKFYLSYIRELHEPVEITKDLSAMDVGNLLHRALKNVYKGDKTFSDAGELAQRMRNAVKRESDRYDIFHISPHAVFELDVIMDRLYRFAENEIARFEKGWNPLYLEYGVDMTFQGMRFSGQIDRVDIREDGGKGCAFIIDYKFSNVGRLRNLRYNEEFSEFQLPLYRLLFRGKHPDFEIDGFGYYNLRDTFELVTVREHGTAEDFTALLDEVIREIRSPEHEFVKTDDLRVCLHCGFARICGRR